MPMNDMMVLRNTIVEQLVARGQRGLSSEGQLAEAYEANSSLEVGRLFVCLSLLHSPELFQTLNKQDAKFKRKQIP